MIKIQVTIKIQIMIKISKIMIEMQIMIKIQVLIKIQKTMIKMQIMIKNRNCVHCLKGSCNILYQQIAMKILPHLYHYDKSWVSRKVVNIESSMGRFRILLSELGLRICAFLVKCKYPVGQRFSKYHVVLICTWYIFINRKI